MLGVERSLGAWFGNARISSIAAVTYVSARALHGLLYVVGVTKLRTGVSGGAGLCVFSAKPLACLAMCLSLERRWWPNAERHAISARML